MNRNRKLIELFIYMIIVVIGIILMVTSNMEKNKENDGFQTGVAYHAIVFDEQSKKQSD